MHTYFSFGLILRDIPNSIPPPTPHPPPTPPPPACYRFRSDCSYPPVQAVPPLLPSPFFSLSRTEETAKAGTCAHDRRALQQLALFVHVKHSDLTWPDLMLLNERCGENYVLMNIYFIFFQIICHHLFWFAVNHGLYMIDMCYLQMHSCK